jgi:hypothetical protein
LYLPHERSNRPSLWAESTTLTRLAALCRQLQILNRPTKELAGVSVGLS